MSTKNLARTVIEGGRARYSRFNRRHTNAIERARTHQLERALCSTADAESAYFPPRAHAYRGFDDKLGPARRWLQSQVGRPWDKVRSELFQRFDTRTTAGRHIVFDHLLNEVLRPPGRYYGIREFWISPHGILRRQSVDRKVRARARRVPTLPEPEVVLLGWLAGRRIVEHGARLYWLVPTTHGGFRQHRELAEDEARRFRSLPGWFRERCAGAPPTADRCD
jgi:hypothetical protein